MSLVGWCAIGFLTPGAVLATIARQRLVEIEFRQFRDSGIADGRPLGGSESRRASSFWGSGQATRRVFIRWLDETPTWAQQSPEALAALRAFRLGVTLLWAGFLATVAVAVWASCPRRLPRSCSAMARLRRPRL